MVFSGNIEHILNPWRIIVDLENESITVTKRNYFLIGIDKKTSFFKFVREVHIDEHLFGANLFIKGIGSNISVYCIPKFKANKIKELLFNYNLSRGKQTIIFS